jgi:macrolide transport system ATP-binding/permease protein
MFWQKLKLLLGRKQADQDLADEVRLHVELRARQLRDQGVGAEESRYEAARQFGNCTLVEESTRETWSWTWIEQLLREFRFAVRALRRSPSFSAVAIISLAAALGANTTVFSFARAILMKKLAAPGAERFVILRQHNEAFHMENCCFTYSFLKELRKQDAGFDDALAVTSMDMTLTDQEQTEKLTGELVSGNYFGMLGVRPAIGRLIDESDAAPGGPAVCVISYKLWQERFGGRADIVGRRVMVNTLEAQIVGVSQAGFSGATMYEAHDLQFPLSSLRLFHPGAPPNMILWVEIVARLRRGVTAAQATARLNAIGPRIEKEAGPDLEGNDQGKNPFRLVDGSQGLDSKKDQFGKPVLMLFGLVGVVLVAACANLTALLLVRNVARTGEAGVRLALGGSRAALVRHFLAESVVLSIAGGVAGWGLAILLTEALLKILDSDGEDLARQVQPDTIVFLFSAAATLAAGIVFGFLPAWRASQSDPLLAMRGAGAPRTRSIASRVLIAAQIAFSLALLFGAGLFARTLHNLRAIDLGFHPENVALLRLSRTNYVPGGADAAQFYGELLSRARALPETRAASLSSISILSGAMAATSIDIPGFVPSGRMPMTSNFLLVSSGYFRTLGIPLVAGRDFTADDRATAGEVAIIVNRQFERQFLAGDATGKAFQVFIGGPKKVRVVGIAGDAHYRWLREDPQPVMYLPLTLPWFPRIVNLQVRNAGNAAATIERLRALVREIDPRAPIEYATTMEMQIDAALSRERLLAFLSTLAGGVAVTLAAIGLYGVISFSVARRTREIGIRVAIGAPRSTILGQFLRESAWMVAGGIALGIPLALGCGRLAQSLLYGLKPQDVTTAIAATGLLALIAFCAALIPAWRAARLDPMVALRWE